MKYYFDMNDAVSGAGSIGRAKIGYTDNQHVIKYLV